MCFRKKEEPINEKEFYNKLVTEKGTPLEQVKVPKKKPTQNNYKLFLLIIFAFTIGTFLINTRHGLLRINSQMKVIPSQNEWNKYASCIAKQTGNCCALPIVSFVHPPDITTVLLARRGVGGNYLRYLVQQGTRVWTGVEECNIVEKLHANYYGGCAGPYHYTHYIMTRFFTPQSIIKEIGFKPTHLIHLTRNPFYALISSYSYFISCEKGWDCTSHEIKTDDFIGNNSKRWNDYALNFASEWVLEYNYANAFNNSIRVYYEDMVKDKLIVLEPVLKFVYQPLLPSLTKKHNSLK